MARKTLALLAALLVALSAAVYHFVVLKAARDGWPGIGQLVKLGARDETTQRDQGVAAPVEEPRIAGDDRRPSGAALRDERVGREGERLFQSGRTARRNRCRCERRARA